MSKLLVSLECSEGSIQLIVFQDSDKIIDEEISTDKIEYDISKLETFVIDIYIKSNSNVKNLKLNIK